MIDFDFIRPKTVEEALAFLGKEGERTRVLVGGTDLLVKLRSLCPEDEDLPRYVMDITALEELRGIEESDGSLSIGPLTTHGEIAVSEPVKKHAPLLAQACSRVGATQLRAVGTIGGNIINASPAADSVPALVALDAEATFRSAGGERRTPLKEIFLKPNQTDIRPDELLVGIDFPKLPEGAKTAFVKLARRNALAISRMNIAVVVVLKDGVAAEVRISPGSATPLPDRIAAAEEVLLGKTPDEELVRRAGEKVSEEMIARSGFRWSTPYKQPVIEALASRALRRALGMEEG